MSEPAPKLSGEVRCPVCSSYAVDRQHGVGWWLALVFSFVGLGLPFLLYMTFRSNRLDDRMRCRMCKATFALARDHLGFPHGMPAAAAAGPTARVDEPGDRRGRRLPVLVLLLVAVATVAGVLFLLRPRVPLPALPAMPGLPALPSLPVGGPPATSQPAAAAPTVVASVKPSPVLTPTAAAVAFERYWVKNFQLTPMWSGPAGQPGVTSFGETSSQLCVFLVVEQQSGARLHVLNPYSNDYLWLDASAVGPSEAPPRRPGEQALDQNCSEADVR